MFLSLKFAVLSVFRVIFWAVKSHTKQYQTKRFRPKKYRLAEYSPDKIVPDKTIHKKQTKEPRQNRDRDEMEISIFTPVNKKTPLAIHLIVFHWTNIKLIIAYFLTNYFELTN